MGIYKGQPSRPAREATRDLGSQQIDGRGTYNQDRVGGAWHCITGNLFGNRDRPGHLLCAILEHKKEKQRKKKVKKEKKRQVPSSCENSLI